MTGSVVARNPRSIKHNRDASLVQRTVHQHLIKGAIQEGRIDRHNRVKPAIGQTRCASNRVLLGDTNVVGAVRITLRETLKSGWPEHRRSDGNNGPLVVADANHLVGKDRSPGGPRFGERLTGVRVNDSDSVKTVSFVVLSRGVPATLVGDGVHDHGVIKIPSSRERELQLLLIVPVDRTDVLQAQILEQSLRGHHILNALLHPVQGVVNRHPHQGSALQYPLAPLHKPFITAGGAQCSEVVSQTANGW